MCTLSWLPHSGGYTLCFNRDERRTRAPAEDPALRERAGVSYLAPLDGEAGGTWLAANARGLTLGLLNRYGPSAGPPPATPSSRGHLIPRLIDAASIEETLARLPLLELERYQPFILAAATAQGVTVAEWDGQRLETREISEPGLAVTSSAADQAAATELRRETFRQAEAAGPLTAARLEALHRSHLPERGARSICMHRDDAETRSYSRVTVFPERIEFYHVPGAPCRTAGPPPLTLPRSTAISSQPLAL